MAISTVHSYFMKGSATGASGITSWEKLFDFKTDPDQSSAPEPLQTTTQSDNAHTYIPGLRSNEQKQYTLNYDLVTYKAIKALEGQELDVAEWFGAAADGITPDGHDGKYAGKGYLDVFWNGGDVNNVRNMTVVLTPTQELTLDET